MTIFLFIFMFKVQMDMVSNFGGDLFYYVFYLMFYINQAWNLL